MIRWEYKAEARPRVKVTEISVALFYGKDKEVERYRTADLTHPDSVAWLNKLGADGWELVHTDYGDCLFKRRIEAMPYREA